MGWLERKVIEAARGGVAQNGGPQSASLTRATRGSGAPTPDELAMQAQTMWQMGRPEGALEILRPALASAPDNYNLNDVAATTYAKLDRYEEAIEFARRAVALRPSTARPYMRLANLLGGANRPQEARKPALTAVEMEPDNPAVLATASEILRRCGDVSQALKLAEKAVQRNPDRHPGLMGRVLVTMGRWQEAEKAFQQALTAYPDGWDARFYLALALIPQGRGAEAKALLQHFMGTHPDHDVIPLLLGRLERWEREEASLRQAVAAGAGAGQTRSELVDLLVAQDRLTEAVQELSAMVAADPDDRQARERLGHLDGQLAARSAGTASEPPAMATLEQEVQDEWERRRVAREAAPAGLT